MAEKKQDKVEREYIIPLRRRFLTMPAYERTGRAVKTIKQFIAKHMKVKDRNVDNVKLDVYFNNELWFKGRASPPSKIRVNAVKEGDIVRVNFVEEPKYVTFLKAKHEKAQKANDGAKETPKVEEKKEEKTEEQKTEEKEKGKAVAVAAEKQTQADVKAEKHVTKAQKQTHQPRMALQK